MLVVRSAGGDGLLGEGSSFPSEAEIKRNYKRRNAELKQRLNELETRLTDTRLAISQLEEGVRQAVEERGKAKGTPSAANESRTPTGQSAAGNKDTDASISLTNATPSNKPGGELHSTMTDDSRQKPPSSSSRHRDRTNDKSKVDDREEQEEQDQNPDRLSQLPSPSEHSANSKADDAHLAKTLTLPVLQPYSPYLNLIEPVSGSSTNRSIRPSGSSGDSERPVSGSSEQFPTSKYFIHPTGASTPPKPQSAKKSRISAGKAFKHGFSIFTKPFGRRSDVVNPTSPLNMTKSISDEHIPAATYGSLTDASNVPKIPSLMNTWTLSPPTGAATSSKSKKSTKHKNGVPEYLEMTRKKSHPGSISSRPSHQHLYQHAQQQQQQQPTPHRDSAATSGAGSEAPASSSSPHAPHQTSSGPANPSGGTGVCAMPLANIIDALYGINMSTVASTQGGGGGGGLVTLSRSSTVAGNNLANYSCGGSTHSGGEARGSLNGGGGMVTPGGGGQLQQQGTVGGPTPPVYNVAMALALMCQRMQTLMDAQTEAQQRVTTEIKEELNSLRSELTETRNFVNTLTVEVDALTRDMQTKEEVANQKLGDAVARLEQLDASAEKLRQNVQQDLITIRNEQKHALEPLKYQLATETRDLRDMFTTLSNKVTILEKCERLSNLDRDQPQMLRSIANTLTDLLVSLVAFITTLIQMLIRFLNAGATVTNNRVSAIVLNVCLLIFLLLLFLPDSIVRWWNRTDGHFLNQYPQPPSSLPPR
ncbi:unnamed protein product [Hymenolepis diminuta]|uniref:Uncharacterized protein n=2 Tax=Hymenolepis diminuta TaxID=6216 RepID=A0A564YQH9_HYMDI|nr:unnamed protein product [Hymenolepis diminuta]